MVFYAAGVFYFGVGAWAEGDDAAVRVGYVGSFMEVEAAAFAVEEVRPERFDGEDAWAGVIVDDDELGLTSH